MRDVAAAGECVRNALGYALVQASCVSPRYHAETSLTFPHS